MSVSEIHNWDRSQSWRPESVHHPVDEDEIVALIYQAAEAGKRLKPIGSALSWSDIIDIPAVAIQFDKMDSIVEVDRDDRLITLQAGVPPMRVNQTLAEYGGRPHWGKSFSLNGQQLQERYPEYDTFNRLRQENDPNGLFRNSFVDRVFPE